MKLLNGINYKICLAAVSAGLISFIFFDKQITLFFAPMKDGALYDVFRQATRFGKAEYTIVPAFIVWIFTRKSNPAAARAALAVCISVAAAGISTDIIKFFVGRMRPVMLLEQGLYGFNPFHYKYEFISFPSGHSADIFGAVCLLILRFRKYVPLLLSVAVLVGLSRIITLHHYTSDVIGGALVGYTASVIVYNKMFAGKNYEKTA